MSASHETTFYVQIDARRYRPINSADERVAAITAVGITQKRPRIPKAGTVLVKLCVRVPDSAFLPLRPEAVVVIPESLAQLTPIEVDAVDPTEGN